MLHVGTQTWITTTSDPSKIGDKYRYTVYSSELWFCRCVLASTVQYGLATPFIISTVLCLIGWLLLLPTKIHSQRKMKRSEE